MSVILQDEEGWPRLIRFVRAATYLEWEWGADVICSLFRAGASVDLRDKDGCTALMVAADSRNAKAVGRILAAGASTCLLDDSGESALLKAARRRCNNRAVACLLTAAVSAGCCPNDPRQSSMRSSGECISQGGGEMPSNDAFPSSQPAPSNGVEAAQDSGTALLLLPEALPLEEVLRHAPWSASATCQEFRQHIEAGRTALHINWQAAEESRRPDQLRALLSRMQLLTHVDGSGGRALYVREVLLPSLPPCLTSLQLNRIKGLVDIEPLRRCGNALRQLELRDCIELVDIGVLGDCRALTSLDLSGCVQLKDIRALAACSQLTSLSVFFCLNVADSSALASCMRLRKLDMSLCSKVADIGFVESCSGSLTSLSLYGCSALRNMSPLAACASLTYIDLSNCAALTDIRPLAACLPALNYIDVRSTIADLADILPVEPSIDGFWLRPALWR